MKHLSKPMSAGHFLTSVFLASQILLTGCSRREQTDILAKVNGQVISIKDFSDNYFQIILYGNQYDSQELRKNHLNLLIDSYILAQHGLKSEVLPADKLKKIEDRARRRSTREALFEMEVVSKAPVPTEKELKNLFTMSNQKVHVRHLFARTKGEIDSLYSLVLSGRGFDELAVSVFEDSVLKFNGGDLGWSEWGDLDPFLEDVAFIMEANSVSKPVESRFGWHILKLENKVFNPIFSEYDFASRRSKLEKMYNRREQDKLYYRFVNDFMIDKTAIIHNPAWSVTAKAVRERFPLDKKPNYLVMNLPFSPEFGAIPNDLEELLDEDIITFPDTRLTVREFLDRIPDLPVRMLYGSIRAATQALIRDHFLAKEGELRGLHKTVAVNRSVTFQKNLRAGAMYRGIMLKEHTVTPDSIDDKTLTTVYDSLKITQYIDKQEFDYTMLVVGDSTQADICDSLLNSSTSFAFVVDKFGIPKSGILESGRFTRNRGALAAPLRTKLLDIEDGEISGWVDLNRKLIKLKRHSVRTSYRPFSEVADEIRREISMKIPHTDLQDSLNEWHSESDIFIDSNLLKGLWEEED